MMSECVTSSENTDIMSRLNELGMTMAA